MHPLEVPLLDVGADPRHLDNVLRASIDEHLHFVDVAGVVVARGKHGFVRDVNDEPIAVRAAFENVDAAAGAQGHRANRESAGVKRLDFVASVTTGQRHLLDACEVVGPFAGDGQRRVIGYARRAGVVGKCEVDVGATCLGHSVRAESANNRVAAATAGERVVPRRADECIGTSTAIEGHEAAGQLRPDETASHRGCFADNAKI